jgi:hypothetical protein
VITSQPNKIKQLQQPEGAYDSQRPTRTTSTWLIGCMKGSMALFWINRWIGHVTQTKHHDIRLEYRASESKSDKWVERKGLTCKEDRRTPEELVVAHITTKRPIREEAKYYNKQRMQHLLLRQKNRMIMWSIYAWHGKYDAMQLIQIKRDRNPDTHIYGSSYFTTRQFKCWLAWQDKAWVSYTKFKWSGETIFGKP